MSGFMNRDSFWLGMLLAALAAVCLYCSIQGPNLASPLRGIRLDRWQSTVLAILFVGGALGMFRSAWKYRS